MSARCALAMVVFAAGAATCHAMGPLHEAAATGNAQFVKSWIAAKRDLDATYDEPSRGLEGNYARQKGITALMAAARAGQLEIVKLLVEAGANLYAESRLRDGSNPRNAFDDAVESGRVAIVEYLWSKSDGVRFAGKLDRHIATSCRLGCSEKSGGEAACYSPRPLELLEFLDKRGVRFPRNTLHCIAYRPQIRNLRPIQDLAVASFLLERGADPNDLPHTPLRGSAAGHDIEMVKLLLARGGDPNLPNGDGLTAIAAAANSCVYGADAAQLEPRQRPQLEVIEDLRQAGADPKPYATEPGRSRVRILANCCSRSPLTATQRRICGVFF